jgi:ABC-type nickel/cobalt efflux system permease component RcnA
LTEYSGLILVLTVGAIGVLHTIVPDHWAPIVVLARQRGWSIARTAQAAALAGLGHVISTLLLGGLLWVVGATLATRYAHLVSIVSALALLAFGLWIAYGGWKEIHATGDAEHGHSHFEHAHVHRHDDGLEHVHPHHHHEEDWHLVEGGVVTMHAHEHDAKGRTALLLVLGSSPMVEGLPVFFSAGAKGPALLAVMAIVFASATIVTYVATCVAGVSGLRRASFGVFEKYGEVSSGLFVAAVGVYALVTA